MSALKSIVFRTAENMKEVKSKSAQIVVMSPAHFSDEKHERQLLDNIFKECGRIVTTNGVVAAGFTDYKRNGGTYPKHLVICEAAYNNGFEVFDHRMVVWSFQRLLFRKGYYHVYVFKRRGQDCWRVKHDAYQPYNYQPWLLTASQQVLDFADALDPEIYEMLIQKFSQKHDLVVLPFAGSGTGVIVALSLGRRALGYELDKSRRKLVSVRERQIKDRICYSPTSPIELYKKNLMVEARVISAKMANTVQEKKYA